MLRIKVSLLLLPLFFFGCKKNDAVEEENTEEPNAPTTISVGVGPDAMILNSDESRLYVANVEDTKITVINTNDETVIKTIAGFENPWGFAKTSTSGHIAVSNYGGQITILDINSDLIHKEKAFDCKFGGIASQSDGKILYAVAISEKKVYKIDALTLDSLDSYDTGNDPDGVALTANDSTLVVTNTSDGTISIINVNSKSTTALSMGGKPELVHSNHNKTRIYVSNFTLNKVHILNGTDASFVQDLDGFDGPEEAIESIDGQYLYVVNFNSSSVDRYEAQGLTKLDESHSTGLKPIGVLPLSGNKKIYVSNYGDNTISVLEFE